MSRDYDQYCNGCKKENARSLYVDNDIQLIQCLKEDCGAMYMAKTVYTKLESKGVSEIHWRTGLREIEKILRGAE